MNTQNTKQSTVNDRLLDLEQDLRKNGNRIIRIAKDNYPLELIINSPFTNFLRKLFLTKYRITYKEWREKGGCPINFSKQSIS